MRMFGNLTALKTALDIRFGKAEAGAVAAAHEIVKAEAGKTWSDQNKAAHVTELKRALNLLEQGDAETKVHYVSASADLQISKASGLVTYCALLCAIATMLLSENSVTTRWGLIVVLATSLIGSALTLVAIWFRWPQQESQLNTAESEYQWLLQLLIDRARLINLAVLFSGTATLAMIVSLSIWVSNMQFKDKSDHTTQTQSVTDAAASTSSVTTSSVSSLTQASAASSAMSSAMSSATSGRTKR